MLGSMTYPGRLPRPAQIALAFVAATTACGTAAVSAPADSGVLADAQETPDASIADAAADASADCPTNTWCPVAVPYSGGFGKVRAATGDLWWTGAAGHPEQTGAVFRWNGGTPVAVGTTVEAWLNDLWVVTEKSITAVGGSRTAAVAQWNGSSWVLDSPASGLGLYAVTMLGADTWAGGGDPQDGTLTLFRSTAGKWLDWSTKPETLPGVVLDFWASSPTALWAVGRVAGHAGRGYIANWDGAKWKPVVDSASDRVSAIWGASASDAWAVGASGVVYHFDGNTWSANRRSDNANLTAIAGSGPNDVWAAGYASDFTSAVVLHWNGQQWTDESPVAASQLRGIGVVGKTVVVVGTGGVLRRNLP